MVEILVTGSLMYTGKEIIKEPYVYIRDGKIEDFGSGLVPEDYTYPQLIIGGENRAIMPGLLGVVNPFIHIKRLPLDERCRLYTEKTVEELFKVIIPLIVTMHKAGYTRLLVEYSGIELPLMLSERIGGGYGALVPEKCLAEGVRPTQHPKLEKVKVVKTTDHLSIREKTKGFCNSPDIYEYSVRLADLMSLDPPRIEKGNSASIIVYNLSEPPFAGLHIENILENPQLLYAYGGQTESVVHGQDILVDVGEHIGVKGSLKESLSVIKRLFPSTG